MIKILFKAILCLFLSISLSAQPIDVKLFDFEMQDTVLLDDDFTIVGKITNVGNLNVPPGVLMNFLITNNVPTTVPQNGIPTFAFNSNSPLLSPGDTILYSKDIEAEDDDFMTNARNIVTIWPKTSSGNDSDTTNNIIIDSIYVTEIATSISNDFPLDAEISLFPNPAIDFMFLKRGKSWGRNITILIYNMQGKTIMISEYESSSQNLKLRVKDLPIGSYTLVAYNSLTAKQLTSKKFVKQ